ncbi:MAG: GDSL-like Lipase/Acylhydrolase family protein, partial [Bacilli bacterium]|nr:GDSL-like Lipase/Acylhydrolase family protein [Bacilli bacterium]
MMDQKASKRPASKLALIGMGLLTVVFMAGMVLAVAEVNPKLRFFTQPLPPPSPANPSNSTNPTSPATSPLLVNPQDGSVHLVAFGDSLTRGLGDLSGKGYIGRVKDALQTQTKKPVVFTNIAVSGQTSTQLDALLNQSEVQGLMKQATLIVFTIGGNDLFGATNQLENLSPSTIDAAGQSYKTHLTSIVAKIRAANGTCPVYLVAIYNPFYTVLDP